MLTINQVKQYLISFFKNHLQINTVVYDSDFNFNAEDDILYKVAQIQPVDPVQTTYNEVIYKFKVVIADILNPNNNDSENDIQSDCISIANDFISYFGDEDFQDFYFDKGISIQTFTEKNGDRIAGCVFAFGVRQTRLFNPCSIPLVNPFTGVSFTGNVTNVYSYYNLLAPYLTIVSASTLFQPKGNYLTGTTVDFTDYYTKEQANALFLTGYTPDLSNYYTKSQTDSKYQLLGNYVSASTLSNYQLVGNYVSASTLANYQPVGSYVSASTLSNYLTASQISAAYQAIGNYVSASTLANYQLAGNYVSASTLSSYFTASQISASYQAIGNYVSASTLANYQLVGNYVSASTLANYQLAGNYVSASTLSQYQQVITLTTTGTSGSATFNSPYINIPTYTLAGLGGISLSALSASSPLSYNNSTGAFTIQSANTSQSGYLLSTDWNTFNSKQAALNGTGYTKFLGTSASYIASIPNADLTNSSITVQGNNVSLGGSINVFNGTGFVKVSGTTISYDNTVYQPALALTTTGTTGAATFDGINLNVPQYAGTTYSASNGITLTGSSFTLGGTLTQNTNTEMSGHTFKYTDTIGTDKFTVGNGAFNITEGTTGTGYSYISVTHGAFNAVTYLANINDNFNFFCNTASLSLNYAQNSSGTSKQISISPTAIQIYDSVSLKGMTYSADYSANGKIDNRWIPDYGAVKSYVSGATSGITNITLSTSGSSGASTLNSGYLNVPTYTLAGLGGQASLTVTTSGNSGSATFNSPYINIPTYTLSGLGGISLSSLTATSPLSYNNATGAFNIQSANTSQSGYLVSTDWNTFNNKQAQLNGTGFVKVSGTTVSYDNTTYQQAITLTTSGTSGAATLNGAYLNIPQYAGGGTAANPSASVGLSAVNGAASTYMRSDAAPALSQSIVPTWTGTHTFSVTNTASATATTNVGTLINHTINQSGAANFTDLLVNRISTSAGTGTQRLLDLQVNGSSTFSVNSGGYLQATNGATLGATQFQVFNQQNTLTDGAYLWNTASSTAAKPVVPSLSVRWQGSVWNTTATAAANYFSYINYATGLSGNTPTSTLVWAGSLTNSFSTPSYSTIMSLSSTGILTLQAPVVTKGYTVSTLPTGVQGMMCYVTDSNSSAVGIIVSGSGSNVKPVFYNGTNWVTM